MTYIPDLAPISYSNQAGPIRAVGWLEARHRFSRGEVSAEFSTRLMALVEQPISFMSYLGLHWCSLCEAKGKSGPDPTSSQSVLLIPASDCVYETPIWIGHYVAAHSYQPPLEFRRAVLSCPEPGSDELRRALLAHIPSLDQGHYSEPPFFLEPSGRAQRTLECGPESGLLKRMLLRLGVGPHR